LDASIIIPVKNGSKFLRDCLLSCFAQETEYAIEIILVDDHSTDDTLLIASEFKKEGKVDFRVITNRGFGISEALNSGISASSADYIIRLDADDVMRPRRVQNQISYMHHHPSVILLGGQIEFLSEVPLDRAPNFYPCSDIALRETLSKGCFFAHPTVLFRKNFVDKVGGYNSNFDGAEDYELWLLLSRFGLIENLDEVLIDYRVHPDQFTVSKRRRSLVATTRVRIYYIFNLGRFRKTAGDPNNSISKYSMAVSLILEFIYFAYGQFRSKL
jgi:glycosyltransferase involved in cell wall biosynthesis